MSRRDESGSISYRYGLMGEVTYEERSFERLTPLEPERSAAMRYRSDYLGRMASITYPYDALTKVDIKVLGEDRRRDIGCGGIEFHLQGAGHGTRRCRFAQCGGNRGGSAGALRGYFR